MPDRPSETAARSELYIGIMTGTSLDAIDLACCRFEQEKVEIAGFYSESWPSALRSLLMELATSDEIEMDRFARSHFLLAEQYTLAVQHALEEFKLRPAEIRAIGLHGQTVRHLPKRISIHDLKPVAATIQLGSGSALAALTGIDVVSDFRSADIALGGQGAPLVPMFDFAFLRSASHDRLITNIGGISNVTWLPATGRKEAVIAFDCGPGNMLLDTVTRQYFHEEYDAGGMHAREGEIDRQLLTELLALPYFHEAPPKSTGRELFSRAFLDPIFIRIDEGSVSPRSALATLTELTARSITDSLQYVTRTAGQSLEIILSGGGALNDFLVERIAANAPDSRVMTSEAVGIPVSAKEAVAFAFFAKAFVEDIPIHLPHTTGASRETRLGSLSRGM